MCSLLTSFLSLSLFLPVSLLSSSHPPLLLHPPPLLFSSLPPSFPLLTSLPSSSISSSPSLLPPSPPPPPSFPHLLYISISHVHKQLWRQSGTLSCSERWKELGHSGWWGILWKLVQTGWGKPVWCVTSLWYCYWNDCPPSLLPSFSFPLSSISLLHTQHYQTDADGLCCRLKYSVNKSKDIEFVVSKEDFSQRKPNTKLKILSLFVCLQSQQ